MKTKYSSHPIARERTFAMLKPDAVMRGLMGQIFTRFEQKGLKVVAMKMVHATEKQIDTFYPKSDEWITRLGTRSMGVYTEYNINVKKELGTDDPYKIGQTIRHGLVKFMSMGPVVPMVVEGLHAVPVVRKMIGASLPQQADNGTIRGDFTHDAPTAAGLELRSIYNLIHASETSPEAAGEIAHWFSEEEILDYDLVHHAVMFGDKR